MADVTITLDAVVAEFNRNMQQARNELEGIRKSAENVDREFQNSQTTLQKFRDITTTLNQGWQITQQVFTAAKKAINSTVGEFSKYALSVKDMSVTTGMATDDLSRLIQVADDFRIEQTTITTAMENAIRKGYTPSAEWLGELANQFAALQNPADRTALSIQIFGKAAGPEMARLLSQGKIALDSYMSSVDKGLVITDEAVKRAEEYYAATDKLNDKWMELKITVGSEVIPALTDLATYASKSIELTERQDHGLVLLDAAYKQGRITIAQYKAGLDKLNISTAQANDYSKTSLDILNRVDKNERDFINTLDNLSDTANATASEIDGLANSINGLPSSKTIDITTRYYTEGAGGEAGNTHGIPVTNPYNPGDAQWEAWNERHGIPMYANGGSFIVPPGYNDTFPVYAKSGEQVTVSKPGQSAGGGTVINIYGYTGDLQQLAREVDRRQNLQRLMQ